MFARTLLVVALALGVQGFAPAHTPMSRAMRPPLRAKGDDAIVPVNDDNVKTTVATVGALAGFTFGGPLFAALGAAGANYVANKVRRSSLVRTERLQPPVFALDVKTKLLFCSTFVLHRRTTSASPPSLQERPCCFSGTCCSGQTLSWR